MKVTTFAAFALFCIPACQAADPFKPMDVKLGLWETTSKTEMSGMPKMGSMPQIPEETLAKMPPAQRAQIEARMKAGPGGPLTNTVKSCITQETLNRGMNFAQRDNSCTYKVISSSATHQQMHSECSRGEMKMAGDITVDRVDAEHVKGEIVMKSAEGGPINMKMSFDTKWLSPDCGDVKPAVVK